MPRFLAPDTACCPMRRPAGIHQETTADEEGPNEWGTESNLLQNQGLLKGAGHGDTEGPDRSDSERLIHSEQGQAADEESTNSSASRGRS